MQFLSLSLSSWRQFSDIEIDFHPRLTILTGPNGAGKTTILNMLSRSFGWSVALMAMPEADRRSIQKAITDLQLPLEYSGNPVGMLRLSSNREVNLNLNDITEIAHSFPPIDGANGVYITSHRKLFSYSKISSIPVTVSAAAEILNLYTEKLKQSYNITRTQELVKDEHQSSFKMKQTLMSLALFGEGNVVISPDDQALDTFRGFETVLRFVLPDEIGFERFYIKMPELYLVSKSGMYPLEALSGGAAAIVDLAWQVFLASKVYSDFAVIIDEPENHLHPSLQKQLMPKLVSAFPSAQFIIATHSPLMINSQEDSSVYVISPSSPGRYEAKLLDFYNKASSSQDTLYEVLGVDGSAPAWASDRLTQIVEKYDGEPDEIAAVRAIRKEIVAAGLSDRIAEALRHYIERRGDD